MKYLPYGSGHRGSATTRLALLAALALAACGPTPDLSSADDVYSRIASERDAVELRGRIDLDMAGTVNTALAAGHRDFTINSSHGGGVLAAVLMANALRGSDSHITVNGECYSACALLVIGVKEKYATAGADIRLHGARRQGVIDERPAQAAADYMIANGVPADLALGRGTGINLYRLTLTDMAAVGIQPAAATR